MNQSRKLLIKALIDIITFLLLFIACILVDAYEFTVDLGVYPGDPSIYHPHKTSSVHFDYLMIVLCLGPVILIIAIETMIQYCTDDLSIRFNKISIGAGYSIKGHLVGSYIFVGLFLQTMALVYFLTDFLKYRIGRDRPNFLALCKPNGTIPTEGFVENFTKVYCTNDDYDIKEGQLSFPSGHTSCTAVTVTWLIIYLHWRLVRIWKDFRAPIIILSILLLAGEAYVGCSRITDYWHHPSDVIAGLILGTVVTSFVFWIYGRHGMKKYLGFDDFMRDSVITSHSSWKT